MPIRPPISDLLDYLAVDHFKQLALFITGVEVTQAIQYFHADQHLTDPNDRGPDNSLRLVAGKPAWVRVYVGSLLATSGVTGTLEIQRRVLGLLWQTVTTLGPQPPGSVTAVAFPDYATERGTIGSSLNFVIPADEMIGTMRLVARVSAGTRSAEQTTTIAVTLRQTLRLAGVMIAYNGPASSAPNAPNLTIAAPAMADLQAMTGDALTLFPIQSTAVIRSAGTIFWTRHLQDPFGTTGCTTNWDALHAAVVNARTADGNQPGWIYYGLLPSGVPIGPVGGCGGGGVSVGPVNQPQILAHECGHSCGLMHAPCGGAPRPDASYPMYLPHMPAGNIGEYGLDINNGTVASSDVFRDLMSYCGPSWISPYHYRKLINTPLLNPTTVGIDHLWWKDLVWKERLKYPRIPDPDPPPFDLDLPVYPPAREISNVISIIVQVRRGVVEVTHVARTVTRAEVDGARPTELTAVLRDAKGAVLAEAPLVRFAIEACGCKDGGAARDDNDYLAQAFIPNVAPGASLEITDGKTALWTRKAPSKRMSVDLMKSSKSDGSQIAVSWRASGNAMEYWLRWSKDGKTWNALATGLTETKAEVDVKALPPGKVWLQVVAHDGFFSTYSKSIELKVPARAPDIAILHPRDGYTYQAGQSLRLWGTAVDAEGTPSSGERCTWTLDGKEVGNGFDVWIAAPKAGKHKLTFRANDAKESSEMAVVFTTTAPPESHSA